MNHPLLLPMTSSNNPYVIYQLCDKSGHTAKLCQSHQNHAYIASFSNSDDNYNDEWMLDLGATHHMMANIYSFKFSPYEAKDIIFIGGGTLLKITHVGIVLLNLNETLSN